MTSTDEYEDSSDFNAIFNISFKAIRIYKGLLSPVTWKIKAHIVDLIEDYDDLTDEEKSYHIELSLSKIRYWFNNCVNGALIFSYDDMAAYNSFFKENNKIFKNKIMITPGNPTDEVLSWIFQSKMNAFSNEGDYLSFPCIEIIADDSNGMEFFYIGDGLLELPEIEEWVGELSYFDEPWWARDDASTFDVKPSEEDDLTEKPSFAYSLDFLGEEFKPMDLGKNKIVKLEFKPTVIEGGNAKSS